MTSKFGFDSVGKWLFICGWVALFAGGATHYPGSWIAYTIFSVVFLAMLISGFYRQVSYGYLFLVVMLWLGFWFKLTVHLWVDYPFGESIGLFDKSELAWDEVLHVATMGSLGVMVGRIFYRLAGGAGSSMLASQSGTRTIAPVWYLAKRRWFWAGLMFVSVGLAITNASLGISQIGLVPSTILLWPLNAVIAWLIGYGLTLAIATLLWWDITLGRNVSLVVYFVLLEAFTSTISTLSRGGYIFHVVPQFLALYKNKNLILGWSRKNVIAACAAFVVLFAIANPVVNLLRAYYYCKPSLAGSEGGRVNALARFAVDRWVGAEGVMAVAGHPNKGIDLLIQGIIERREIGKDTLYSEISRPVYLGVADKSKFQFSEIPGAIAFLYYAGQLWVVVLGMALLVLALLGSECLVFRLTNNPILAALWGGLVANTVAQLGVAPRGLLIYFFEMSCGIAVIYVIQMQSFPRVLQKLRGIKNVKSGG